MVMVEDKPTLLSLPISTGLIFFQEKHHWPEITPSRFFAITHDKKGYRFYKLNPGRKQNNPSPKNFKATIVPGKNKDLCF
jgi:hypothetical protein